MMESLPKRQTQESTKLGLKPLRNGVRNGAELGLMMSN